MAFSVNVEALAEVFVPKTIAILHKEYPNILLHHLADETDVRSPQALHPAFYGCYDWHSSVHSHWQIVRALRLFPNASFVADGRAAVNRSLTAENIAAEMAYVSNRRSFEMPYGMAWLLQLAAELHEWDSPDARRWRQALLPLECHASDSLTGYFNRLPFPIRSGLHNQTAFAMSMALDWADSTGANEVTGSIKQRARTFFENDRNAPLAYEPSGVDFLSPALAEADLMRRILPAAEFAAWLNGFFGDVDLSSHLVPATVLDAADGQLAHFAGLNMSRAWMLQSISSVLPDGDARVEAFQALAQELLNLGLHSALDDDYMIAHWAPSFVLYLLTGRGLG